MHYSVMLQVRYLQKTCQIIFLPIWQTFLNFGGFWIAAQLSQLIRDLQNSKKNSKKAKIWFHEFFKNTSPLVFSKFQSEANKISYFGIPWSFNHRWLWYINNRFYFDIKKIRLIPNNMNNKYNKSQKINMHLP